MHESKRQNLQGMSNEDRYGYLVRKAADFEQVWGLYDDGWALAGDSDGGRSIPIWPEAGFATDCATGRWDSYTPRAIALDDLLRAWLPGMASDGVSVAAFPVPSGEAAQVAPDRFAADLRDEVQQYE